jgi:hypothetical protein
MPRTTIVAQQTQPIYVRSVSKPCSTTPPCGLTMPSQRQHVQPRPETQHNTSHSSVRASFPSRNQRQSRRVATRTTRRDASQQQHQQPKTKNRRCVKGRRRQNSLDPLSSRQFSTRMQKRRPERRQSGPQRYSTPSQLLLEWCQNAGYGISKVGCEILVLTRFYRFE